MKTQKQYGNRRISVPYCYFSVFYYLTNDRKDELGLPLLCEPELRAALDEALSENLAERRLDWSVENDAFDSQGNPVLLAYLCDMPRIRRLGTALGLYGRMGTLICFDSQGNALQRVCGPRVNIQTLDFQRVEALLA